MVKQIWWLALAAGLGCSSSGSGGADADDGARARDGAGAGVQGRDIEGRATEGRATELAPGDVDRGGATNAGDELSLLETATGLVVQIERDGQLIERSCTGSCGDVCKGCLLEACQLSGAPALCNAAADACENRCNACVSANAQSMCDAPSCAGDLSCYFVTVGVPEEFRDVVRGASRGPGAPQPLSPQPGTSDPVEHAATPAEPGAADPSAAESGAGESGAGESSAGESSAGESSAGPSSGEGNGAGAY